jgi:5-enolpyruvylshikimate-3-phosphate synthase
MKTILLVGMILLGLVGMGQNTINLATQYNVINFTNSCLSELGVSGVIVSISDLPFKIAGEYDGQTKKIDSNNYAIYISSLLTFQQFRNVLSHEIVHVWQYQTKLKITGNSVAFEGMNYTSTEDKHFDQPHEKEAREKGIILYNKFKSDY